MSRFGCAELLCEPLPVRGTRRRTVHHSSGFGGRFPQIRALVLFGGAVGGDWENSSADSWTWNGSTWTQVHPATTPPNRYDFAMSYDPGEKAVLMFGGFSTADAQGGPWLLALTP